jgi:RimJ/RimL family protein N-acetyltransferase
VDQIVFNDPDHGEQIAIRAGGAFDKRTCSVISRLRNGELLGGVLYANFTGESVAMFTAGWDPHWLNRDLLYVIFDYPFNQLGVKRIFGLVSEDNVHARRFNAKFGGKDIARIEGMFRGNVAGIIMCLERDACRLMGVKPRTIQTNRH